MRLFIVLFFLFFTCCTWAQKPFIRDYSLIETNADVKVNALAQDTYGYLWLATDIGLIRYNGQSFQKITDSIHKPVTAITLCGKNVWVGYNNGKIGVVINLQVRQMDIKNGPASSITSLFSNGINVLLAGTEEQGVFVIMNGVGTSINSSAGLSDNFIYDIGLVGNDHILAASDVGINDISFVNGKLSVSKCTTRQGLPDNIVSAIKNIPGTPLFLVGTQEGGVVMYDGITKKITPVTSPDKTWSFGQVNDILAISPGHAWFATEGGYILEWTMNDSGHAHITPYYYPAKSFKKILRDKTGNIWCASSRGLSMLTAEYVMDVRLNKPYSLYDVTAMIWGDDALFVSMKKSLYKLVLKDSAAKLNPVFTAKATISSLFRDKAGRFWIGTIGDGLYYEKNRSSFVKLTGINEVGPDASILNISGTGDRIWLSGLKGVEELSYPEGGIVSLVRHHGKKNGIGSDYVYQLYPDHKGNIWMATDGAGVCMFDGLQYHHWNSVFDPGSKVAYSITEDNSGDIWAATMYKDLFHFHQNKWNNLRLPETQYPDINISAVSANATGQVLSVYQRCIDEWYPQSGYFRHFNSALGIGIDSTSNVLNCIAKDNAGNIYVPYQHGILMFKNQREQFDIRPRVHIMHPVVFSKPVLNGRHNFDHDENYMGFTFEGISFANHERLNYRYTLQGYNDGWIYTNDASASYAKLSPGNYKFRVQISLNPAFEHPTEDGYYFSIAAPFWKTNWFYVFSTMFVLMMGYAYIKLRERRLKSIAQLQQERMMFEYEHLKSQVNPHFLFNSLYALSILIEEKKENALSYTVHLADLYRNMLTHSRHDVISLEEELEILNNYTQIQQTRFGTALRVNIDIPAEVMETKKIVPLAIQLLVENAIKHNVVSMTQPLIIDISATKDEIVVRNQVQPKISNEKGAGIGLINIKQRYSLLTKKPVTYGVHENQFIVQLPLL
jgi:ligand-binding sensor domain-containing protein